MFNKCYKCFRPQSTCYCSSITPVETGIKFVFLMHPKEAFKQKTGTGRLTSLSLVDSEIIIGIDFTFNKRLNLLLSGDAQYAHYFPVLLFPSRDAYFTDTPKFCAAVTKQKLMIIVVDATWYLAQKMVKLSTNLKLLPKLSFKNEYRSQFSIKQQPDPVCLSTIESSYYLIEELKSAGVVNPSVDQSGLMKVFRQMVTFQQRCTQSRHEEEAQELYPDLFL
jgi:DTW domain-containing protein